MRNRIEIEVEKEKNQNKPKPHSNPAQEPTSLAQQPKPTPPSPFPRSHFGPARAAARIPPQPGPRSAPAQLSSQRSPRARPPPSPQPARPLPPLTDAWTPPVSGSTFPFLSPRRATARPISSASSPGSLSRCTPRSPALTLLLALADPPAPSPPRHCRLKP